MDLYMLLLLLSLLNQLFSPGSCLVLYKGNGKDSVGPDCSTEFKSVGPTPACPGCLSEFNLEGDYVLGGLFQLHESNLTAVNAENYPYALPCYRMTFSPAGYLQLQVMRFAVETINNSSSLLPGVRLGYRLLDYCDPSLSFSAALDLLTPSQQKAAEVPVWNGAPHRPRVISVTGPYGSSATIAVAPLFMDSLIPMVTHAASSAELSSKTLFPSFFRTIPSDVNQVQAMITLLQRFDWNWVAFLASNDAYGQDAMSSFQEETSTSNICLAYQDTLPSDVSSFPSIFKTLRSLNVQVVVLFASVDIVIPFLMAAIAEQKTNGKGARVWIGSETWSDNLQLLSLPGMQSIGVVLGVTLKRHKALDGLEEFVTRSIASSTAEYGCDQVCNKACPSCLTTSPATVLKQDSTFNFAILAAMHAIAHALHLVLHCGNQSCRNSTVQPYMVTAALKSVNFELDNQTITFDQNGDPPAFYDIVNWNWLSGRQAINTIGSFASVPTPTLLVNESLVYWFGGSNKVPVLQCSSECRPGFQRVQLNLHPCCYSCVICLQGTYINSTADPYSCLPCLDLEWSLNGSTSCLQRTVVYLGVFDPLGMLLLLLASILLLITVATLGLFLWQRATPVVRSAGGPLCYFMLVCLSLSATSVLLHLGVPTPLICLLRYPSFIVLYGAVLSCLTVRSFQIFSIFKMASKLQGVQACWVRYHGQWVAVAGSTGLLLFLCVVWLGVDSPKPVKYLLPSSVVLDCSFGSLTTFSLPTLVVALLSMACFLFSYLGTDLPAGYNEARSISLSLLVFFLSWTLAITVQLSATQTHLLYVNAFAMLSSLFGIQVGYFMPKCYIIIVRPERNTTAYFQTAIQSYNLQSR